MSPTCGLADLPKWQIALCLLLIALVVYNPYLVAPELSGDTCFRHAPSNRATVGASELQHFTPADGRSFLATATVAILGHLGRLAPPAYQSRRWARETVSSPIVMQSASLWFRPPPAV
ncbi:MAG TPA: hypothetical protein VKF79_09755 [Candidatus Acidoferrum sp.]|nr:hypothetical protein [Candidatus Acidoferrum sp.]